MGFFVLLRVAAASLPIAPNNPRQAAQAPTALVSQIGRRRPTRAMAPS